MPCFRAISATVTPALASFRIATIYDAVQHGELLHCFYLHTNLFALPPLPLLTDRGGYRHFHTLIIHTMMLLLSHDSATGWEEVLGVTSGGSRARRFARARRVCPGRVHRRCSRSPIPDTIRNNPATAKAGGCIGCRVARPLSEAAAPELAGLQGASTSARSVAADGGAEICCVA